MSVAALSVSAVTPLAQLVHRAERRFDRWSVESQLRARRNAMVASTELAQRRAERREVEEFLAHRDPAPAPRANETRASR
ncbi:hypothetical protein [Nocardioides sp. W7]|uniref:hypothetical protein n=1 Tax=Nocardioides sp. W7 TaxID=2931390 RepID=UPI001FD4F160|nr:hypothetical protein [Nocardioides sp. W7]